MNATKIQQPSKFFPVSSKQFLYSPVLPPICLQQRASGHHLDNFTCRSIFYEVPRNDPKCSRPTACSTPSALLSVMLHTFNPCHEVLLNKAIGVLCLEGRLGLCERRRCNSFQLCSNFSLRFLKFPYTAHV